MRLPAQLAGRLWRRVAPHMRRDPDVVIGGAERPYLRRWFVIPRNPLLNLYLHEFLRSDDDRALHDHPWLNFSVLLRGAYVEHTIACGGVHHRRAYHEGDLKFRRAVAAHRIELIATAAYPVGEPCVTLFITGPRLRRWGFHCPNGWRHWKLFTDPTGRTVGAGCGDRAPMSAQEREEQRRSFAHGNAAIDNPRVTRAMVDHAADALDGRP